MTHDVVALLDAALQQRPEDRDAWIERTCTGNAALATELRALLEADAAAFGILEQPFHVVAGRLGLAIENEGTRRIGSRVGPYRLVSLLGSGGMGLVYRAERDDSGFTQIVALKLIRTEKLTDYARERFLLERRILARMTHPHIAHLIDSGISAHDEPWFAMEYVDGKPLLLWCDSRRLTIEARLHLMLDICDAVEFAHSHLVIHRDIKPANVFVDAVGNAKLLDFGIAKLLGDEDASVLVTATQTRLLTPEYAAPEQIRGDAVTTATDVHALGLLLYELLCGQRAFGRTGLSRFDVQREVLEAPPALMSARLAQSHASAATDIERIASERQRDFKTLRRELQGDLQHIVDKASRKEPAERYASVGALADDIRRYLANQPVIAAGGAGSYRLRKFVQRHRIAVISSGLALVSLIVGMIGIGIESQRANLAAKRAEAEAARAGDEAQTAIAVRDFLLEVFKSADPQNALGKTPNAIDLLDAGARRIETELRAQPELQAQLLDVVGNIYGNLGRYSAAIDALRKGREVLARSVDAEPALAMQIDFDQASLVGSNLSRIDPSMVKSLSEEVQPPLDAVIENQRKLPPPERNLLVRALVTRSQFERNRGDASRSEASLREAVAEAVPQGAASNVDLAYALDALGDLLTEAHRHIEALAVEREAVAIYSRRFGRFDARNPQVTRAQRHLANSLSETGATTEAINMMRQVAQAQREVLGENHPAYADVLLTLGDILVRNNQLAEAEPLLNQAMQIAETSSGAESDNVAYTSNSLAMLKRAQGDNVAAIALERRALTIWVTKHGPDYSQALIEQHNLAAVEYENGNYLEAQTEFLDLDARRRKAGLNPYDQELTYLGRIERMLGHPEKALAMFTEAALQANNMSGGELSQSSLLLKIDQAKAERDLGDLDAARRSGDAALSGLLQTLPTDHPGVITARYILAQLDYLQGRCAMSAAALEAQWNRYKQRVGPAAEWHSAEAGLLVGLCRKQRNLADHEALIATNANELVKSPIADPFSRNLAREALIKR